MISKPTTTMRYFILSVFTFFSFISKAQLFLPEFEKLQKLEVLNSSGEESMPIPYNNGDKIFFVRTYVDGTLKQKSQGQEVYQSSRIDSVWGEPNNLFKRANDKGNNAVIGSSSNGDRIYLFNSIQSHKKLSRGIGYIEKDSIGEWSKIKNIEIPNFQIGMGYYSFYINQQEDILLVSMSPDENTIEEDLFVSLKDKDGNWSAFINLGPTINTEGYELSPFIAKDKKTLYFSSDGHRGLGEADIFVSYRLSDSWNEWSKPLNMGSQINSSAFDAYFIMGNNKEVYFTSNRDSEYSDIYYTRSTGEVKIGVKVLAQFNYRGLLGDSTMLQIYDDQGNLIDEVIADAYGRFEFYKLNQEDNYLVKLAADEPKNYPGGVVYVMNQAGKKMQRLIIDENGNFIPVDSLGEDDIQLISGIFNYNRLPVKNVQLVIYDENGFPVDTIITDAYGRFKYEKIRRDENITIRPLEGEDVSGLVYFIDDEGNRQERYVVSANSKEYLRSKFMGVFKYNQLAMKNATLVIVDENGFPIDTITTDEYGRFDYNRLGIDENMRMIPIEGEEVSGLVYFTDENGNKVARYVVTDGDLDLDLLEGIFKYNALPLANSRVVVYDKNGFPLDTLETDAYGRFSYNKMSMDEEIRIVPIDEEDAGGIVYYIDENGNKVARYESVDEALLFAGLFEYNNLPMKNTTLVVYDANGYAVDTIITDAYGKFEFNKMSLDNGYTVKPINTEDLEGLVYIKDKNGNRVARYVVTKDGEYISNASALLERDLLKGRFNYKSLPMKNVAIVILDENGFPLDTIYTDEFGQFEYDKMRIDENYSFKPLNIEDMSFEDLELYLEGDMGRLNPTSKNSISGFVYNSTPKATSGPQYTYSDDSDYKVQTNEDYVVYFFYNDWQIKANDATIINNISSSIKASQKVKLVGHTDNIGSSENNLKVARWRAEAVRDYLINKGIAVEDKITIISHGEKYPKSSNETSKGRGVNRRVEIFIN